GGGEVGQILEPARVGQLVEDDDPTSGLSASTWRTKAEPMKPAPPVISHDSIAVPSPAALPSASGALPDLPRCVVVLDQLLEPLLVLERVHALPEAVVAIRVQLALRDQTLERLVDELLALAKVVEDRLPENEEAAVNPVVQVLDRVDGRDGAVGVRVDEMEARVGLHADEGRDLVALLE